MAGSAERIAEVLREELPNFEEGHRLRTILEPVLSELEIEAQLPRLDFEAFPKTGSEVKAELERQGQQVYWLWTSQAPSKKDGKREI